MAKLSAAYQGMKQAGHKMSGGMCEACGGECKYSGGGEVKGVHHSSMEIDRPLDRKEKKWAGESEAGHTLSLADTGAEHKFDAISKHKQMLGEIVAMKNPKLKGLADGGPVVLDPDKVAQWNSGFKHAEGGEIEGMDSDGDTDGDGMMEACADELFSAMKSGNKKEFVESLKALIMSMKG